ACAIAAISDPACLTTGVTLTQDIYTPNLHRPPFSSDTWADERPYAAWLGVGMEGRRVSARALRTVAIAVGVTGKPSLGEAMQDIAHHITARWTTEAHGWETQVGFQPGIVAGVRQSLLAAKLSAGGRGIFDLAPYAGVNVGNILTDAELGGKARLGINLSHPWDPRASRQRPRWEFDVNAGGRLDYVAHNFSLDGTLIHPDRRVDRTPTVRQHEFGAELRIMKLSLAYRAMTRSREYSTGPNHFTWSSMSAGIEFFR
ncbi:MAG: lipid A deacylase LpxR family protein, partial [Gemmatimonadaceae bacterium]